jgi:hypothetical protein
LTPRAAAALLLLGTLLLASPAWSFVRTATCRTSTNRADPLACKEGETPIPIFWDRSCVVYHIARSGLPPSQDPEDVYDAIRQSFQTWADASCSYLALLDGGFTNEDRVGYNSCAPSKNANIIIFRDTHWRHQSGALALTSVTYDVRSGEIVDADIELNSTAGIVYTTSDLVGQINIDVRNTVTHEAGHLLGLDHTPVEDATMFATAPRGETKKRDLHQDDLAGVCAIYPRGEEAGLACDRSRIGFFERPEQGPQSQCSSDRDGCACGAAGSGGAGLPALLMLGAAVVWWLRRASRCARRMF